MITTIIAIAEARMYSIRSLVVAKFPGAVVAVGAGVAVAAAALTETVVAPEELP